MVFSQVNATRRLFTFFICTFLLFCSFPVNAQGLIVIRDQEIEDSLNEISAPIFEQAGFSNDDIRIILVKSDAVNAFVAGGKNIFINTGLILKSDNVEEVLGVLAHELSHIASGHLVRTKKVMEGLSVQSLLTTIAGIAAVVLAGDTGAGTAIFTGGQAAAISSFLKHSRIQESAADQGGIAYLKGAGISPKGFLGFMRKLEHEELLPSSQQSAYIRTHPLSQERVNFLEYAFDKSPYKNKSVSVEWHKKYARMKAKIIGFVHPSRALLLKDKTSVPALYARAIALYRLSRITESLEIIAKLIAKEPENPYFYELKAQILFENGKIKKAVQAYKNSVELLPNAGLIKISYAHALIEYSKTLNVKGKVFLGEAIEELQKSKKYELYNPRLYHFLGIAYGIIGKEGLARLNLAEEAVLKNKIDDAKRQIAYAERELGEGNAQAKLRLQDLKYLIDQRKKDKN